MSETNAKVASLFSSSITALTDIIAGGRARSARIRFTDPSRAGFNFWWISVDKLDGDNGSEPKLWAATNDIDLLVGTPPSFWKSVPMSSGAELVDAVVAFLSEKFAGASRVEILLQADAIQGQPRIPNHVGNSDDGFENIVEEPVIDVF